MNVLIIESFVLIIERLEELLSDIRHTGTLRSAFSYAEGMQLFTENRPDAVILSIGALTQDSAKFLSDIRMAGFTTPVIVLSVNMDEYVEKQYRSLGANHFLDKYSDFEKLPAILGQIAGNIKPC